MDASARADVMLLDGIVRRRSDRTLETLLAMDGDPKHLAATRNDLGFALDQSFVISGWRDGMERLFYNAALGVLPLRSDGAAFYYAEYNEVGAKGYN